jgi:hypothetical protein
LKVTYLEAPLVLRDLLCGHPLFTRGKLPALLAPHFLNQTVDSTIVMAYPAAKIFFSGSAYCLHYLAFGSGYLLVAARTLDVEYGVARIIG